MSISKQKLWEWLLPLRRLRFHTLRGAAKLLGHRPALRQAYLHVEGAEMPPGCELVCKLAPPPRLLQIPPPRRVEGEADPFFAAHESREVFDRTLACIRGGVLDAADGLLFLPDDSVLLENHFFFTHFVVNYPSYYRRKPVSRTIEGPVFTLLAYCPAAHYHWMTDVLYRFYDALERLPAGTSFLIPKQASALQRRTLEAFGIRPERLIEVDAGERVRLAELWYASPVLPSGFDLPEVTRWVSDKLTGYFLGGRAEAGKKRKLYVTRAGALTRRVTNEEAVWELLESRGFQRIDCAAMTLEDQVQSFAEAAQIVAPHGAGLVNLMFAPAGCAVLELFPAEISAGGMCYWSLSAARQLDYTYLKGKTKRNDDRDPDIVVPVPLLKEWLDRAATGIPDAQSAEPARSAVRPQPATPVKQRVIRP